MWGGVGREHRLLWQGLWRLLGSDSPSVREGSQILNLLMNEYSQPVVIDYNRFFPVKKLLCLLGVLWPIHYRISKPQPTSLAEWQSSGVCEDINRGRFSRQLAVVKKMLTSKDVLVRALVTPLLFGARLEVPRDTSISSSFAAPAEWPKPAKRFVEQVFSSLQVVALLAPYGAGKTFLLSHIFQEKVKQGRKVAYLTTTNELVADFSSTLAKMGVAAVAALRTFSSLQMHCFFVRVGSSCH